MNGVTKQSHLRQALVLRYAETQKIIFQILCRPEIFPTLLEGSQHLRVAQDHIENVTADLHKVGIEHRQWRIPDYDHAYPSSRRRSRTDSYQIHPGNDQSRPSRRIVLP